MRDVLNSVWQATLNAYAIVRDWVLSLDTMGQAMLALGLLVAILFLAFLGSFAKPKPKRKKRKGLDVVISQGELSVADDVQTLTMNVSNMTGKPVQMLELALQTEQMDVPICIPVSDLLPPYKSLPLNLQLEGFAGRSGSMKLFLYSADAPKKTYQLQSELVWEPWNARYTISSLGQVVKPARDLASARVYKAEETAWRKEQQQIKAAEHRESQARMEEDRLEKMRIERQKLEQERMELERLRADQIAREQAENERYERLRQEEERRVAATKAKIEAARAEEDRIKRERERLQRLRQESAQPASVAPETAESVRQNVLIVNNAMVEQPVAVAAESQIPPQGQELEEKPKEERKARLEFPSNFD